MSDTNTIDTTSGAGLALAIPATIIDGALQLREGITFEEWKSGLKVFKEIDQRWKMHFSDYVRLGQITFTKEKANIALGQLEFNMPVMKAALTIAGVPEKLRKPSLNAEHYLVLARADITPAQKERWAQQAHVHNLEPSRLKASIEAGEIVPTSVAKKNTHGVLNIHGIAYELGLWIKQVGGVEGILEMDRDHRLEILEHLKQAVELGMSIEASLNEEIE